MRCCQLHLAGLGRSAADETGEQAALGLLVAADGRIRNDRFMPWAAFAGRTIDCAGALQRRGLHSTWRIDDPLQLGL